MTPQDTNIFKTLNFFYIYTYGSPNIFREYLYFLKYYSPKFIEWKGISVEPRHMFLRHNEQFKKEYEDIITTTGYARCLRLKFLKYGVTQHPFETVGLTLKGLAMYYMLRRNNGLI